MRQFYKYNNRKSSNFRKQWVPLYSNEQLKALEGTVSSIEFEKLSRKKRLIIHRVF